MSCVRMIVSVEDVSIEVCCTQELLIDTQYVML